MAQVRDKFGRQYRGIGYNALVTVEVAGSTGTLCNEVQFSDNWHGYRDCNWIGDGDPYWQQGAVVGVQYALRVAGQTGRNVTVIKIEGDYTVTNPTIVGAAAIDGVWQSVGYVPSPSQVEQIQETVFSSWQHSVGDEFPRELPDFEQNIVQNIVLK